jgi:glycosyltransferase involved in cell wall biosynthesis
VRNLVVEMARQRPGLALTLHAPQGDHAPLRAELLARAPELEGRLAFLPPEALPRAQASLAWYPWAVIPAATPRVPLVVSLHDLAPMLQHDHRWWKVAKRCKYRWRFRRTVQRAAAVLTLSEFSREEILRHLGADPRRVHVTLLAADDLPLALPEATAPLERAGVADGAPFFLTVGGQEGRKNLRTLYAAMARLQAEGETVPLVQCGPGVGPDTRALAARAPWWRHVGFVSDAELVTLYRRATALVFPSRYEGFGLPVLEAMAAGGRVVCANASSLPEVCGDAALTFPWDDVEALTAHLRRLLHDPAAGAALAAAGPAQAARFSWARAAAETLAVFDAVAADAVAGQRPWQVGQ